MLSNPLSAIHALGLIVAFRRKTLRLVLETSPPSAHGMFETLWFLTCARLEAHRLREDFCKLWGGCNT